VVALSPLDRYDRAARRAAAVLIAEYSTSFGLATRLLPVTTRGHIRDIYALVRLADEVVDGVARQSGLDESQIRAALDQLEEQVDLALTTGYSTNPVVHAFGLTAREVGIERALVTPFFSSMRMDLERTRHDEASFARYVDGSAEVVGLMCLRAFTIGRRLSVEERDRLESGARRLGAAFQKVNFLRDLAADADGLGRAYFPGVVPAELDEATKHRLLDDIDADLAAAAAALPLLDPGPRRAVATAHGLFSALAERLRATPAEQLRRARVRVPDAEKLAIAARAVTRRVPGRE
jgi:phytoene/squalene synthetase